MTNEQHLENFYNDLERKWKRKIDGKERLGLAYDLIEEDLKQADKFYQKEFKKPQGHVTRDYYRKKRKKLELWKLYFDTFTEYREYFLKRIEEEEKFNRDSITKTVSDIKDKTSRRYIVTSAVAGQSLNKPFFQTMQTYCKKSGAKMVILPMRGVSRSDDEFPDELKEYADIFCSEYRFLDKLVAIDPLLYPQHINPLVGITRFSKNTSTIVASPKMHMQSIAVSSTKLPYVMYSSGTCCNPDTYAYTRNGRIGKYDHTVGALIVETDGKLFHIRQVKADKNGGFFDLDKYYSPDGKVVKSSTTAFVMGDYHSFYEDETAIAAWKDCIKLTRPKYIIWHDLLDFKNVNHHEEHNIIARANIPTVINTLEKELDYAGGQLLKWKNEFTDIEFVIVRSNHDDFLFNYLRQGKYVKDPINHRLSLTLAGYLLDDYNPIEKYLCNKFPELKKGIKWLGIEDDFKINGVVLGQHGHCGANGVKGSPVQMANIYDSSISGHTHSPKIFRGSLTIGTTSKLKLSYNVAGASSWLHASGILHKNGAKQLIISINGEYRLK